MLTLRATWPCAGWMKMDYSKEPITPSNLSSSSPERREADAGRARDRQTGRREKNKWLVTTTATMMIEERGDHTEFGEPHLKARRCTHPWQTSTTKHQPGGRGWRVTQRPWGPAAGQSFPQSLYTHAIPIPHAPLTSLLKHRSKSPDWSQWLRNKWRQIPDSCLAFLYREARRGLQPPDLAFHLCKYILILENVVPNSPHDFRGSDFCLSCAALLSNNTWKSD